MKKTSEKASSDTQVDTHLGKAQNAADAPQVDTRGRWAVYLSHGNAVNVTPIDPDDWYEARFSQGDICLFVSAKDVSEAIWTAQAEYRNMLDSPRSRVNE